MTSSQAISRGNLQAIIDGNHVLGGVDHEDREDECASSAAGGWGVLKEASRGRAEGITAYRSEKNGEA